MFLLKFFLTILIILVNIISISKAETLTFPTNLVAIQLILFYYLPLVPLQQFLVIQEHFYLPQLHQQEILK